AIGVTGLEIRAATGRLHPSSLLATLSNAAFALGAVFVVMTGDFAPWRALALAVMGVASIVVGIQFARRRGDEDPFALLQAGTGLAFTTVAIAVQFEGPAVAVGLAAEATALAMVYARRRSVAAGIGAIVLEGLALGHLMLNEFPLRWLFSGAIVPLASPSSV